MGVLTKPLQYLADALMYSRVRAQIPLSVFAPRYGTRSFIK